MRYLTPEIRNVLVYESMFLLLPCLVQIIDLKVKVALTLYIENINTPTLRQACGQTKRSFILQRVVVRDRMDASIPMEVAKTSRRNGETTENRGDVADEDMLDLKEIKLSRFDSEKRSQEK